jgi:hypothetical protein
MIDSFAQYGQLEAKDTVDRLLEIPWFRDNQRCLYQLLSSYNNVIRNLDCLERHSSSRSSREQLNKDMYLFFHAYKSLINFDQNDENRIGKFVENKDLLDAIVINLTRLLTNEMAD